MAQVNKAVLGKVRGALGDVVFRERDGKSFVGVRPTSFIPGKDQASIDRRLRFLLALKSASSINSISKLKFLWAGVTPSGLSPFNYIIKSNYRLVASTTLSDLLKIVPDNGFGVTVTESNVDGTAVHVVIDAIRNNAGIDPVLEPRIMMASIVFLSLPVDESVGAYLILSVVSPQQNTKLDIPLTFDADFTSQQQAVFNKYQSTKTFIAIVTLDTASQPVHYSGTVLLP